MRFAWDKSAAPNLMNKEGLPASAFRSGKEPRARHPRAEGSPNQRIMNSSTPLTLPRPSGDLVYDVDHRAQIAGPIDRVAYLLELRKQGAPLQWVYVSMDAFTTDLAKLGVPTLLVQGEVPDRRSAHMNVLSSDSHITTGKDLAGNIEFFPNNYGPVNTARVPNASDAIWDFGDQIGVSRRRLWFHAGPQLRRQADDLRLQ